MAGPPTGAPSDHPEQHAVLLHKMMAQRACDVQHDQHREAIRQHLVGIVDRSCTARSTLVTRAGMGTPRSRGSWASGTSLRRPTRQRHHDDENAKPDVTAMRGEPLPRPAAGRRRRDRIEPAPQQANDRERKHVITERRVPGAVRKPLRPRRHVRHPQRGQAAPGWRARRSSESPWRAKPIRRSNCSMPALRRRANLASRAPPSACAKSSLAI